MASFVVVVVGFWGGGGGEGGLLCSFWKRFFFFFFFSFFFFFFWWKICNVSVMFLLLYVHVCVTRTGWKTRPWPKTVILPIKKSNQSNRTILTELDGQNVLPVILDVAHSCYLMHGDPVQQLLATHNVHSPHTHVLGHGLYGWGCFCVHWYSMWVFMVLFYA